MPHKHLLDDVGSCKAGNGDRYLDAAPVDALMIGMLSRIYAKSIIMLNAFHKMSKIGCECRFENRWGVEQPRT